MPNTKIPAVDGNIWELSEEKYEIVYIDGLDDIFYHSGKYSLGTIVRKISGVDKSSVVGHHPSGKGFVTVCRDDAVLAEFAGFPVDAVKLLA